MVILRWVGNEIFSSSNHNNISQRLTCCQGTDHNTTCTQTSQVSLANPFLRPSWSNGKQYCRSSCSFAFVDQRQYSISRWEIMAATPAMVPRKGQQPFSCYPSCFLRQCQWNRKYLAQTLNSKLSHGVWICLNKIGPKPE